VNYTLDAVWPSHRFMAELHAATEPNERGPHSRTLQTPPGPVTLEIYPRNEGLIYLNWMYAPVPRRGASKRAMSLLCTLADDHQVEVLLHPKPTGEHPITSADLRSHYQRHGFEDEPPKFMRRPPKKVAPGG